MLVSQLPCALNLVHQNEDNVTKFEFDFSEWVSKYGNGSFFIKHQRYGDTEPYVVEDVVIEDNIATWTVNDVDTAVNGVGEAELNFVGEDFHKKSDRFSTITDKALDSSGEVPEPTEDWLVRMAEIRDEAVEAADNAELSAQDAEDAAERAAEALIFEYSNGRLTIRRNTNG